ncbi:DNA/RNA nuclease SfsA [Pseudochrobactrum sp. HB0163]|uniref:DNA/RNA nuclease SfsA n=1 Tax=Pseudochrobactrum sp. HB0163 TaxID=3450708 RepID=UPI003F6DE417
MLFPSPLIRGTLLQRYKRFLADIRLSSGEEITASVPNTGSMRGLTTPGSPVWLSHSANTTRKYEYMLQIVEAENTLVGINTGLPNKIAEEAILAGMIPELTGFSTLKREQKYGRNSRIDILLTTGNGQKTYVEVKNVHFKRTDTLAEFPDSVTARGARHLAELGAMVQAGHRGVMLFVIQRNDCDSMSVCADLDPVYAAAFTKARQHGVEAYAIRCHISPEAIFADQTVPVLTL